MSLHKQILLKVNQISVQKIFNTKTMTLGDNIQNLDILMPNEGHHAAGEDNEARFLDQHFVPRMQL